MNLAQLRAHCMALPGTTEEIQWGDHLIFKVVGKVYAVTAPDDPALPLSIKCDPGEFDELTERPGILQAPYFARRKWVRIESSNALPTAELRQRITQSYELVRAGLTKKLQAELAQPQASSAAKARARSKASLP